MIFDTNLIIYSIQPTFPGLLRLFKKLAPSVSAVSLIEVLGFHKLTASDKLKFEANLKAIENAGIRARSQLLKLAIIVD